MKQSFLLLNISLKIAAFTFGMLFATSLFACSCIVRDARLKSFYGSLKPSSIVVFGKVANIQADSYQDADVSAPTGRRIERRPSTGTIQFEVAAVARGTTRQTIFIVVYPEPCGFLDLAAFSIASEWVLNLSEVHPTTEGRRYRVNASMCSGPAVLSVVKGLVKGPLFSNATDELPLSQFLDDLRSSKPPPAFAAILESVTRDKDEKVFRAKAAMAASEAEAAVTKRHAEIAASIAKSIQDNYTRAMALRKEGQVREAVRLLREAAEPGYGPASKALYEIFTHGEGDQLPDPIEASKYRDLELWRNQNDYQRAMALRKDGHVREAVRLLRQASQYGPASKALYEIFARGEGDQLPDPMQASMYRDLAILLNQNDYKRATALRKEGRVQEAVRLLRQASELGHGPASKALYEIFSSGEGDQFADPGEAAKYKTIAISQNQEVDRCFCARGHSLSFGSLSCRTLVALRTATGSCTTNE